MAGKLDYRGLPGKRGTWIWYLPGSGVDHAKEFWLALREAPATAGGAAAPSADVTPLKLSYQETNPFMGKPWPDDHWAVNVDNTVIMGADKAGRSFNVAVYATSDDAKNDQSRLESDAIAFHPQKQGQVTIPRAFPAGDPRTVIQQIWKDYFPSDYEYKTGPVHVPGRKNIFDVSGYEGPKDPNATPGTSCGDVLNGVLQLMDCPVRKVFTHADEKAPVWIKPDATARLVPKVGDIYILFKMKKGASLDDAKNPDNFTEFAHTGFIKSAPDPYGGIVTWITVDGGSGLKSNGVQKALESDGSKPNVQWTNGYLQKLGGDATDPEGLRRITGWADLEALMKAKPS